MYDEDYGLATHLAIFDVVLVFDGTIDQHQAAFPAIGAADLSLGHSQHLGHHVRLRAVRAV